MHLHGTAFSAGKRVFPVYTLNSGGRLQLEFDDIGEGNISDIIIPLFCAIITGNLGEPGNPSIIYQRVYAKQDQHFYRYSSIAFT